MQKLSTTAPQVVEFRQEIENRLRRRVLEAIEDVLEEEVQEALGCQWYERGSSRRGYRNGRELRRVTTGLGLREMRGMVDILINVPSRDTQRIQEAHALIGHLYCDLVERALFSQRAR